MQAGLAQRAEHSPRKREAGGSSPPASTRGTRGETVDAAASEAAAATAWRFKSFRVHHLQHVIILRFDRTRLRTGLQLRGSLCKTRSWSLCAVPLRSQSPPYSALGSFSRARRMPTSMATTRLLRPCSAQRTCLRFGNGSTRLGVPRPVRFVCMSEFGNPTAIRSRCRRRNAMRGELRRETSRRPSLRATAIGAATAAYPLLMRAFERSPVSFIRTPSLGRTMMSVSSTPPFSAFGSSMTMSCRTAMAARRLRTTSSSLAPSATTERTVTP